ncbi:hypothetical protein M5K25_020586 [Dendrobium thyrsiflorum]|uniref:Uncharacterized protein n=1 Tax=Dendrobium thyrsiflorum TaxID=117978 RepID=A0ABD0UHB7_DENTH
MEREGEARSGLAQRKPCMDGLGSGGGGRFTHGDGRRVGRRLQRHGCKWDLAGDVNAGRRLGHGGSNAFGITRRTKEIIRGGGMELVLLKYRRSKRFERMMVKVFDVVYITLCEMNGIILGLIDTIVEGTKSKGNAQSTFRNLVDVRECKDAHWYVSSSQRMVGEWMMDSIKIPWFRHPGSSWSLFYLVRGGSRPNLTEGSLSAAMGCFIQGYLDLMPLGSIRALAITVYPAMPFGGKTAGASDRSGESCEISIHEMVVVALEMIGMEDVDILKQANGPGRRSAHREESYLHCRRAPVAAPNQNVVTSVPTGREVVEGATLNSNEEVGEVCERKIDGYLHCERAPVAAPGQNVVTSVPTGREVGQGAKSSGNEVKAGQERAMHARTRPFSATCTVNHYCSRRQIRHEQGFGLQVAGFLRWILSMGGRTIQVSVFTVHQLGKY